MSDDLIPFDNKLTEMEQMTFEQLNVYSTTAINLQLRHLNYTLNLVKEKQNKQQLEIEILKDENRKTKEVAVNSMRVEQNRYEYYNQGDFGRLFSVSLGAQTVGQLLKAVGLAMRAKGPTTPYRKYVDKYAKIDATTKYPVVRWHYENCVEFIDQWLKERNLYEKFYAIESEKARQQLINDLYENTLN